MAKVLFPDPESPQSQKTPPLRASSALSPLGGSIDLRLDVGLSQASGGKGTVHYRKKGRKVKARTVIRVLALGVE